MANAFLRKISKDVGTSPTAIGSYTVGTGKSATIIGLNVANVSSSTVTADVFLSDGNTLGYLVKGALIPPGGALVVVGGDQKVVLQANDQVRVQSSAATSLDVVLSILEIS